MNIHIYTTLYHRFTYKCFPHGVQRGRAKVKEGRHCEWPRECSHTHNNKQTDGQPLMMMMMHLYTQETALCTQQYIVALEWFFWWMDLRGGFFVCLCCCLVDFWRLSTDCYLVCCFACDGVTVATNSSRMRLERWPPQHIYKCMYKRKCIRRAVCSAAQCKARDMLWGHEFCVCVCDDGHAICSGCCCCRSLLGRLVWVCLCAPLRGDDCGGLVDCGMHAYVLWLRR